MNKPPLTLLIIDDDPGDVALLRRLVGELDEWEGECLEAKDLPSARPALARQDLDLILLDYRLEDGSGLELLRELREHGETRPIVLVTAYGDEEVVAEALRTGADDYLSKHRLDPPALRRALAGALERHRRKGERARLEQSLLQAKDQEIKRLTRLYAALSQVNHALLQASSRQTLFDRTCEALVEFGGFSLACIRWSETEAPLLRVASVYRARSGFQEPECRLPCLPGEERLFQDDRIRGHNAGFDASLTPCSCEGAQGPRGASTVVVPLQLGGRTCGLLTVLSKEADFFGAQEAALLEEVALDISFALDTLALRDRHARAEAALRESEERYRLIFEHAPLGILHFDAKGVIHSCNEAFGQQLGSSREALRGFEMLARITHEGVRKAIQDACEGNKGLYEGPYVSVTGRRTAYGRVHTCALHTSEGEFLGGMGIVEDLSDLKRLEEERQRITDLYAALSQANQAIVHATNEAGLYPEICRILVDWAHFDLASIGRPAPDGTRVEVVVSEGPLKAYLEDVEVHLDPQSPLGQGPSGCCLRGNREQVCQDWELDPRMQPWRERAATFGIRSSAAFPLALEGRVVASLNLYSTEVGFFRPDRLELLREMALDLAFALEGFAREARRQRAEEAFRATFEQAAVGFTHMAPEGGFLRVNQRFVEMTGYPEEELLALSFSDITHPDDGESDARNLRALLEGMSRSQSREKRYLCKDGHLLWVKLTTSLVRHPDGTPLYFVNVVEDITQQKFDEEVRHRMEASLHQAQKMESLGALAAGIAHDMNNLLAAIMGMAEVMQATCDPEGPFTKSITTILRAAGRGRDLVKGLTSFARKGLDEPTLLDLNEVVREELELLRRTTLRKVEVRSELDPALPPIVGEPSALSSVLMNLCVNAMDAMPQGGTLSIRTDTLADGWVELAVSDTGQGMPPDVLARAMEPFFTTKPVGKGTGLGLSVVFGVLQAHGGTVALQSEPGKGTSIRLRFPIAASGVLSTLRGPVVVKPGQNPIRILLVDDEELILETVPQLLGSLGHRTEIARDGLEALARLDAGLEVDLMVLDQCMPILTGSETLERLRKRWPRLPVILATGYLDAAVEAKVAAFARVKILRKPYALAEIRHVIQEILSE